MPEHEYISLDKKTIDITGKRYGRLVVKGPVKRTHDRKIIWRCLCDCGNFTDVSASSLRQNFTKSCGCLRREVTASRTATHRMSLHPMYRIWRQIITRCTNTNDKSFANYGGRENPITVCEEWRHSFELFYKQVSQLPHYGEKGYSIDRIDNLKGYFIENVHFATTTEQARNKRNNHLITYQGTTKCIREWSYILGIAEQTLYRRLKRGWSIEKSFETSVDKKYWHRQKKST